MFELGNELVKLNELLKQDGQYDSDNDFDDVSLMLSFSKVLSNIKPISGYCTKQKIWTRRYWCK